MRGLAWAAMLLALIGCDGPDVIEDAGEDAGELPRSDAGPGSPDAGRDAGSSVPVDAGGDAGEQLEDAGVDAAVAPDAGCERTYYRDADGDGFGDAGDSVSACVRPGGYVDNDEDCFDGNADAFPGQPSLFYEDRGDGSFDYNCDGETNYEREEVGSCPDTTTDPVTPGTTGWWLAEGGGPAPCGVVGSYKTNAASCPGPLMHFLQRCR